MVCQTICVWTGVEVITFENNGGIITHRHHHTPPPFLSRRRDLKTWLDTSVVESNLNFYTSLHFECTQVISCRLQKHNPVFFSFSVKPLPHPFFSIWYFCSFTPQTRWHWKYQTLLFSLVVSNNKIKLVSPFKVLWRPIKIAFSTLSWRRRLYNSWK